MRSNKPGVSTPKNTPPSNGSHAELGKNYSAEMATPVVNDASELTTPVTTSTAEQKTPLIDRASVTKAVETDQLSSSSSPLSQALANASAGAQPPSPRLVEKSDSIMSDSSGAGANGSPRSIIDITQLNLNPDEYYINMLKHPDRRIYNPQASWLKYRRVLVDWMCECCDEFTTYPIITSVAIRLLDLSFNKLAAENQQCPRNNLQLFAIACILIAAKFEWLEEDAPSCSELNKIAQFAYSSDEIIQAEREALFHLNWNISIKTPLHFSYYYHHYHGANAYELTKKGDGVIEKVKKYMGRYIDFFNELCAQDYSFEQYKPSILGASLVFSARLSLSKLLNSLWPRQLHELTHYSALDLEACVKHVMKTYLFNFPDSKLSLPSQTQSLLEGDFSDHMAMILGPDVPCASSLPGPCESLKVKAISANHQSHTGASALAQQSITNTNAAASFSSPSVKTVDDGATKTEQAKDTDKVAGSVHQDTARVPKPVKPMVKAKPQPGLLKRSKPLKHTNPQPTTQESSCLIL